MKKYNRKINLYIQGQRWAARVLLIVWLCVHCCLEGALAGSECQIAQSGSVSSTGLLEGLRSNEHSVRQEALENFKKLARIDPAPLAQLHKLVHFQEYYATRKAAVEALGILLEHCKVTGLESVEILLKVLEYDPEINVREAAGSVLKQIRVLVPAAFKVLKEATDKIDWDVRTVAKEVLKEVTVDVVEPPTSTRCP